MGKGGGNERVGERSRTLLLHGADCEHHHYRGSKFARLDQREAAPWGAASTFRWLWFSVRFLNATNFSQPRRPLKAVTTRSPPGHRLNLFVAGMHQRRAVSKVSIPLWPRITLDGMCQCGIPIGVGGRDGSLARIRPGGACSAGLRNHGS
jgi:hypothetical protein